MIASAILPSYAPPPPTPRWQPYWRRVDTAYGPMVVNRYDQYIGWSLMAYGEYGGEEVEFLRGLVEPGDTVIDVGANIGALAIPLSDKVGPGGLVIAFEPQPEVFALLVENAALTWERRLLLSPHALNRQAGELVVPPLDYAAVNNFGGVSLQEGGEGTRVQVLTLDEFLADEPIVNLRLVKIDVEGMESDVLKGARATIQRHRPILYVEADRSEKIDELCDTLDELGYSWSQHQPFLYRENNFFSNPVNVFGGVASLNLVCRPK